MTTPNGRFELQTRLCLSMSDYHPETWQPSWSLATVLQGVLSFMCETTVTAGSVETDDRTKKDLAAKSRAWNWSQPEFIAMAEQFLPAIAPPEGWTAPVPLPAVGALHGLSKAELNGQKGVVLEILESGRVSV